ncbi:ABC transporter ATP-binding protein [Aquihabitans daechungensis]|uniref:ABC transporter ATP-binding protein n=1 Tax=Aquihabitans daechungensis TaxID=1052257 RepID=UPI003BA0BFBF
MITVTGLTKHYGGRTAVDDLSFTIAHGRVTGFVGPNGAGKSTTMRMMVGRTQPDRGEVRYGGIRYTDLRNPARLVGTVLDPRCMHPGHTARNHLRAMAALSDIAGARVDAVLAEVGLESAADQRTGGFSLGMRQRLALAGALLGDPQVLLLDEPSNGLDPDGIRWLRNHLTTFARNGGSVFVSSHLIGELAMFADDLVVVGGGRLLAAETVDALTARQTATVVAETAQHAEARRGPRRPWRQRRHRRRPPRHPWRHQGRRLPARVRPRHPARRAQRDRAIARGHPARPHRRLRRVRLRLNHLLTHRTERQGPEP